MLLHWVISLYSGCTQFRGLRKCVCHNPLTYNHWAMSPPLCRPCLFTQNLVRRCFPFCLTPNNYTLQGSGSDPSRNKTIKTTIRCSSNSSSRKRSEKYWLTGKKKNKVCCPLRSCISVPLSATEVALKMCYCLVCRCSVTSAQFTRKTFHLESSNTENYM